MQANQKTQLISFSHFENEEKETRARGHSGERFLVTALFEDTIHFVEAGSSRQQLS